MDPFKFVKVFGIFGYFVRELVYDKKDITNFKDAKFSSRKFGIFVVLMISIFINLFLFYRLLALSSNLYDVQRKHDKVHAKLETCTGMDRDMLHIQMEFEEKASKK